jgi:hypothetical protein
VGWGSPLSSANVIWRYTQIWTLRETSRKMSKNDWLVRTGKTGVYINASKIAAYIPLTSVKCYKCKNQVWATWLPRISIGLNIKYIRYKRNLEERFFWWKKKEIYISQRMIPWPSISFLFIIRHNPKRDNCGVNLISVSEWRSQVMTWFACGGARLCKAIK